MYIWLDVLCFWEPDCLTCKLLWWLQFFQLSIQHQFPSITEKMWLYLQVNTVGVLVIIVRLSLAYCLWFCVSKSWYTTWVNSILSGSYLEMEQSALEYLVIHEIHHFLQPWFRTVIWCTSVLLCYLLELGHVSHWVAPRTVMKTTWLQISKKQEYAQCCQ